MKGLIIKDFINLKKNFKMFALLTLLYGVMVLVSSETSFFSSVITMLFAVLTLSLYSYDDMAKWDVFAQTLPITKEDIVKGKYTMMLLLTLLGAIYSSVFTFLFNLYFKESLFYNFENIGIGAAVVIFFYCIILPLITKLGVEKARIILFAVYIIPFIGITTLHKMINEGGLVIPTWVIRMMEILVENVFLIVPLFLIFVIVISYTISLGIYRKKEF